MGAELCCEPYVVVVGVLGVTLIGCYLIIYGDCRRCSVGNCAHWDSYVAETCCAACACNVER